MDKTPVIDLTEALNRSMGDATFLKKMLEELHQTLPDSLGCIQSALESNDLTSLFKKAHQLKGAAANLGAKTVASAALKLEQIGRSGDPLGSVQALSELRAAADDFNRHFLQIDWLSFSTD